MDIEPAWTQEVLHDPDLVAFEPDPKSHIGGTRLIGDSPSANAVLVVIAYRDHVIAGRGLPALPI